MVREVGPAPAEHQGEHGRRPGRASLSCRRIAPEHLEAGMLQGDLDWIVMKALEKDRTRRYGGRPTALAADVMRHLANEPGAGRSPGPRLLGSGSSPASIASG